jgi:hypothetical protein
MRANQDSDTAYPQVEFTGENAEAKALFKRLVDLWERSRHGSRMVAQAGIRIRWLAHRITMPRDATVTDELRRRGLAIGPHPGLAAADFEVG